MSARILTMQRQAREIGRLRTGFTVTSTSSSGKEYERATKSETWILTSPQREPIEVAAEIWGGDPQQWKPQGSGPEQWRVITQATAIAALLPPGDPISQHYERWGRGGCEVRCDGETARNPDGRTAPCLCRAKHGNEFYREPPTEVCRPHTRLRLILPQLPELGVWRVETQGYYAANDLPAQVDLIRAAVGPAPLVPISLAIVPFARVKQGKTLQTQTIVLSVRGITAGQLLAGQVPGRIEQSQPLPAIEAPATAPDQVQLALRAVLADIDECKTPQALLDLWATVTKNEVLQRASAAVAYQIKAAFQARKYALQPRTSEPQPEQPAPEPALFAHEPTMVELPPDPTPPKQADAEPATQAPSGLSTQQVWQQILNEAGHRGWPLNRVTSTFEKTVSVSHFDADADAMVAFLELLKDGKLG